MCLTCTINNTELHVLRKRREAVDLNLSGSALAVSGVRMSSGQLLDTLFPIGKTDFICISFVLQASIKTCYMVNEVCPEDTLTSQYKAQVQSRLLKCPFCSETFEKSSDKVLFAHMLCHVLE